VRSSFRNPWPDIREGRNLDAYVVAFLAVLVALLSLFGIASEHVALAVTLSALVILTVQSLRMTTLLERSPANTGLTFRLYDDRDYAAEIGRSKRVSMLVTANDRFLAANGTAFRACLDGGGEIRELLFDTASDWGMRTVTSRSVGASKNVEYILLRSQAANAKIDELARYRSPGTVEVRKTPHPAAHVVLWLEFPKESGVLYLTPGAFGIRTEERLTARIDEYDNKDAYRYFTDYFENLWTWEETTRVAIP